MTWNHRVVRRVYHTGEVGYAIHEAYYPGKPEPKPDSITCDPVDVYGETVEELKITLERMLRCLNAPVIDYDTREPIGD